MRYLALLLLSLASLTACAGSSPKHQSTTPAPAPNPSPQHPTVTELHNPEFLEQYAQTMGFSLGTPSSFRITPNGNAVLFLRSKRDSYVRDLFLLDANTGQTRPLITAAQLLDGANEELSPEERARRERLRLRGAGITSFDLSKDGTHLLIPLSGKLYLYAIADGSVRVLDTGDDYANAADLSPDGKKVAYVKNGDLYVLDIASGREKKLTSREGEHVENGLAEFVAQEEMGRRQGFWWAPDSQSLVYQKTDTSEVEQFAIIDPAHPENGAQLNAYPRPGKENAKVELGIVKVTGGKTRWIEWDRNALPYVTQVSWSGNAPLTVIVQNRAQTELQLLQVDPKTGKTGVMHTERDETWLNLDQTVPAFLDDGERFLWTTERNGAWQLELRNTDGELLKTLSNTELGLRGVEHIDEAAGQVYVAASREPSEAHIARIDLNSGEATWLTETPGLHGASFGPNGDLWIHTQHSQTGESLISVMKGDQTVGQIDSLAPEAPFRPNLEWLSVGEREFRSVVVRPRDFDASKHYPVIVQVYAGPHAQTVLASPRGYLRHQWLADQGFIVVSMDGRGTPNRGREWERAIKHDLIKVPMADQVAALEALGAKYKEMDMTRVGVTGWSFGGYFSAMAVLMRPDVFHAAIAGAPVVDWRDYDTHYTERYMGMPDANKAGYDASSALTYAEGLTRPLTLIHGSGDDNVYFMHTVKLSAALTRAGHDHGFILLGGTHMVADPAIMLALQSQAVNFFKTHLGTPQLGPRPDWAPATDR